MPPRPAINVNPVAFIVTSSQPPPLSLLSLNAVVPDDPLPMASSGQPETGPSQQNAAAATTSPISPHNTHPNSGAASLTHGAKKIPGHHHPHHKDTSYIHKQLKPKAKKQENSQQPGATKDRLIPKTTEPATKSPKGRRALPAQEARAATAGKGRQRNSVTTEELDTGKALADQEGAHTAPLQYIDPYQLENELKNIQKSQNTSHTANLQAIDPHLLESELKNIQNSLNEDNPQNPQESDPDTTEVQNTGAYTSGQPGRALDNVTSVDEQTSFPKNPPTSVHELGDVQIEIEETKANVMPDVWKEVDLQTTDTNVESPEVPQSRDLAHPAPQSRGPARPAPGRLAAAFHRLANSLRCNKCKT